MTLSLAEIDEFFGNHDKEFISQIWGKYVDNQIPERKIPRKVR